MSKAEEGNKVKVHYTGKLEDGTVFDSSKERDEPLEFTLGDGQLIQGFESAVQGMEEGESKTVNIDSQDAYGERRDDLEMEVEKSELPDEVEPQVGLQLQMKQPGSEQAIPVQITKVTDQKVTLDANHPLAGKNLVFDIELLEVK